MTVKCTQAVIAVAGYGTRRLPITKAIEKCMMPVGNRPIVDYMVEACLQAGITDITFVVSEQNEQIRAYYGENQALEAYLQQHGKQAQLGEIVRLRTKATFRFVIQNRSQPYGTSTPVWLAKEHLVPGKPFLFLYGDNLYYNADGSSAITSFLAGTSKAQATAGMMVVPVPKELVSFYGIVATTRKGDVDIFQRIVEKPRSEEAPSNLNNAGCFLLNDTIFPFVERSMTDSPQAECFITDAVNWFAAAGNEVAVVRLQGEYMDCGAVEGWLEANNRIVGRKE